MPKTYREVRIALMRAGWTKLRQRGSHEIWGSRDGTRGTTVAGRDSDTVPPGTLAEIRRQTGLDELR